MISFRNLISFAVPHRWPLLGLIGLTILSSAVLLSVPWLGGQVVGGILDNKMRGGIVTYLVAALTTLAVINVATQALSSATSARILADLREQIYGHLQALPLSFHHNRRQGDVLALATFEIARLGRFLTSTIVSFPSRVLTALGAAVLMFQIAPTLALLVPTLVPIFYVILKIVGRRLRQIAYAAQQAEADVLATVEKNLSSLAAIKSFAREHSEAATYGHHVRRSMAMSIKEGRVQALLEPLISLIAANGAILLLVLAGKGVAEGQMTPSQLFGFLFYAALLTRPIASLAHLYGEVQSARGTLQRLQSVLNQSVERGYVGRELVKPSCGDIRFDGVTFGYPNRNLLLRDLSLHILPGEKVALIGDNGAGKTTLMHLLLRFVDPDAGIIQIDAHDISTLQVQDLRRQIGVVPQQAILINGSIRDNIAYGLEDATDAQILEAARLAQALDFILTLPLGLETQIGDHGVRLSGGQRQRVSLARALIKNPPIMLLDEATSMFDLAGELAFLEACADALHGRTVLFTTHRPASLAIADRILCVRHGTVSDVTSTKRGQPEQRQPRV